ncbi:MAG TPA: HAD family hydrolase [Erysipelotrichaceae bacterium]|nr:HAD family hydrolase [Erysipelotrichaceae bacterium]
MNSINTILFDLDGTLLPINGEAFEAIYFKGLSSYFLDKYEPKEFIKIIWSATKAMVKDTSSKTNEEAFMEALKLIVNDDITWMQERFNTFYLNEFDQIRQAVIPNEYVQKAVKLLKEKGYRLVIATNPMFPKIAIEKRIEWTGCDRNDFEYVTSFEKNHYCKPQLKFYEEVLSDLNLKPEECLMVGNDLNEDMIVSHLNMKTYLITNHIMQNEALPDSVTYSGEYEDFYTFVNELAPIK